MACVLPMTPVYSFSDDFSDIHNNDRNNFDFRWQNSKYSHSGLTDSHRCSSPCRTEACTGSSIPPRADASNGFQGRIKHEEFNVYFDMGCAKKVINEQGLTDRLNDSDKHLPANVPGKERVNSLCNKTDMDIAQTSTTNHGQKRKIEDTHFDEVYIPSKRVSPFLNTPKERKDKRKKIINISSKKMKQLDDPETFLRRTVLVNNTMKRLQMELREEKLRTKKLKSNKQFYISGIGVLNNKLNSHSCFVNDHFLNCVNEKITDDMTDTLMNNVFHDKIDDTPISHDSSEESDISNEMEIDVAESESNNISNHVLGRSEDNAEHCTCERNRIVTDSRKECHYSTCSDDRTDMSVDRCIDFDEAGRCSVNSFTDNFSNASCDNYLTQNGLRTMLKTQA